MNENSGTFSPQWSQPQYHFLEGGKGLSGVDIWLNRLKQARHSLPTTTVHPRKLVMLSDTTTGLSRPPFPAATDGLNRDTWFIHYGIGAYVGVHTGLKRRSAQHQIRTVAFLHSDEDWYYDAATHFEAMVNQFVCVSDTIAQNLKARLPHRTRSIHTLPYALFPPSDTTRDFPSGRKLRIAYAGRYVQQQKRVLDFVPFAEQLQRLGVNFELNLFGKGSDENQLRRLARKSPSFRDGYLKIHPMQSPERMMKIWGETDVCLMLSEFEGTSIAMLEAMSAGVVPVVTTVSGSRELIHNEHNGFHSRDTHQLANFLKRLASDQDLLSRCSQEARATIGRQFNDQHYLKTLDQIIGQAWQNPPPQVSEPLLDPISNYLLRRIAMTESSISYRLGRLLTAPFSPIAHWFGK